MTATLDDVFARDQGGGDETFGDQGANEEARCQKDEEQREEMNVGQVPAAAGAAQRDPVTVGSGGHRR